MTYIHFTEEQKYRASCVDLVEFLRRQGEKLIRSGPEYPWTGTVICGQCGSIFKRKKCRESAYWTCRLHDKSPDNCLLGWEPRELCHAERAAGKVVARRQDP